MSKNIDGTFSLSELLNITYHSKYKTRFEYSERDVIKHIQVIRQVELKPDQKGAPTLSYLFITRSYPQYGNYLRYTKSSKQRKVHHDYENVLSIEADENGKFSMDSKKWKYRLGTQKKIPTSIPEKDVKTVSRNLAAKWKKEYEKDCAIAQKKYSGKQLKKELSKAKKLYDKKKQDHIKNAKYVDDGDYIAKRYGINLDFCCRCQSTFQYFNHLYGRNSYPEGEVDKIYMFAPKHMIALLNSLIKLKILY